MPLRAARLPPRCGTFAPWLQWATAGLLSLLSLGLTAAPPATQLAQSAVETSRPAPARPSVSEQVIYVLYPEIGDPYRNVFAQIVAGIEQRARSRVVTQRITASTNVPEIMDALRRSDARSVIALGRNGMRLAESLESGLPIVAGAVLHTSENDGNRLQVHSLAPAPALLFARLKQISPGVRRVFTVFNAEQNGWLMKQASEAARQHGLELIRSDVTDARSAARAFRDIFATADPAHDAVWLPQDSIAVDDAVVLPYVLEESWNRSVTLFSSSLGHVRRGALFALFPDNVELGQRLASAAQQSSASNNARGMLPLQDALLAVNVRTANHLGLRLRPSEVGASLVFPSP